MKGECKINDIASLGTLWEYNIRNKLFRLTAKLKRLTAKSQLGRIAETLNVSKLKAKLIISCDDRLFSDREFS